MRGRLVVILLLCGSVFANGLLSRLAAPIFYEFGLEPGFQSNPLNLSETEIEKAGSDPDYLDGISYSSSNVLSLYGKLNYSPRIFGGRKTRLSALAFAHQYRDIPERSYESFTLSIRQSLGAYRYLDLGYGILPELYLRNYLFRDPASQMLERRACAFGSERGWIGLEQRLNRQERLNVRYTHRTELYQAPFAAYDMVMEELSVTLESDRLKRFPLEFEVQYGVSDNHNDIDSKDRSYVYLNIRPSVTLKLPGKHQLSVDGRYDQRKYNSEGNADPLHAGRYQDEVWLEMTFRPSIPGALVVEPFAGYRERRVDSIDEDVAELKSFQRFWFGVRLGFKSVINMYL